MPSVFPAIMPIQIGKTNIYAIQDRGGTMLIDAATPGQGKRIMRALEKKGISPEDIKLIVITHVHYDHVGSLAEFLRALPSPCAVAVHDNEAALLRDGKSVLPAGTSTFGRMMMNFLTRLARPFPGLIRFEPVSPDVLITRETFLNPFGISGRILPTPGHTAGSLTVILENGAAFAGDLAVNYYPWGGPIFPPVADDVPLLMKSWQALLAQPVKMIYPGHGRPFDVARLRRAYEKRMSIR